MEINEPLVNKIAGLARLHFEPVQKAAIQQDLQRMVAFAEKLNELDTTGVDPLLHITQNTNILRPDEVQGSLPQQTGLQNAPLADEQFFKVPKVIKKED